MRVIIDTNVFISGIFWSGSPAQIMKLWEERKLSLILSDEIFEEYKRVAFHLEEQYGPIDLEPFFDLLIFYGEFYTPIKSSKVICKDPDDDKFLNCALAASVNIVISGDKELLSLSNYQGVEILKPAAFLKKFTKG
ncbi:MAG: putative toxin-antitoxin system toxin component, PIN family [Bacteriovoracales bacterium]|nr:putative toxin-antitoxin system toxin component, PIN family [Bacteriovoracales bacterium]